MVLGQFVRGFLVMKLSVPGWLYERDCTSVVSGTRHLPREILAHDCCGDPSLRRPNVLPSLFFARLLLSIYRHVIVPGLCF